MVKDIFSGHAETYSKFRPGYPQALYDFLYLHTPAYNLAWDCGTGNGQVAKELSKKFKHVRASDISLEQLRFASMAENITYMQSDETALDSPDHHFDLITVATAIHWFSFERFYKEVKRTLKPGGVIGVWCYQLLRVNPAIDALLDDLCYNVMEPYWEPERQYVEDGYTKIPFPFSEIEHPPFSIQINWSADHLEGYIRSWSAYQKYMKHHAGDPIPAFMEKMKQYWKGEMAIHIDLPVRIGRVV